MSLGIYSSDITNFRHHSFMAKINRKKAAKLLELLQQGLAFQNSGRLQEAEVSYRQVLAVDPDNSDALHLIGLLAAQVGQHEEALKFIGRAVALNPGFHQAQRNLGLVYFDLKRYEEAIKPFRTALRLRPGDAELHVLIADSLKGCGRWEEAIEAYRQALAAGVADASEVHAQMGRLYLGHGELESAGDAFLQAWSLNHANADAIVGVVMSNARRLDESHIRAIDELLKGGELDDGKKRSFHFALGSYYDKQKEYNRAFEHYREGNSLRALSFDAQSMGAEVDELIRVFDHERVNHSALQGSDSTQPIFVLGLPRSGTTLVEQILSSHSQVYGAGEITALAQAIDRHMQPLGLAYPTGVADIDGATLEAIASDYLQTLDALSGHAPHVVNKFPGNFAHIGFIRMAFPKAKIIHCERDLRDVALSNYFSDFGERQPWSHDLGHIGSYIKHYRRLMAHWQELCGDAVYSLHYEALVQDLEPEIRRLLAACGLEWEEACLNFHEKGGAVNTASVSQVRQRVYTSSIGRWRHYAEYLRPLFESSGMDDDEGRYWY